jgi:hypothetical protein
MAFAHADREPDAAPPDAVHGVLCELVAGMMGDACGHEPRHPHLSFFAMGGTEAQAAELAKMVNALFGLDLRGDSVFRSPTPDALARTIESAWSEGGGRAPDLVELIDVIADPE